jgi:hypothetical protein
MILLPIYPLLQYAKLVSGARFSIMIFLGGSARWGIWYIKIPTLPALQMGFFPYGHY